MGLNYIQDIKIDPMALDVEWLHQPELVRKYAKNFAQLKREAMDAEERIKVIRSELTKMAMENPKKHLGRDKYTSGDIEQFYRNHSKHQEAKQEWIDAVYEMTYAEQMLWAIVGRKKSLEGLVSLYIAQYFAGPKVPRDLKSEWEKFLEEKEQNKRIAKSMRRRRKPNS